MKNKIKGLLFRIPGILILLVAVIGSFYVKITEALPIGWATPITLVIIFALYAYGEYKSLKEDSLW